MSPDPSTRVAVKLVLTEAQVFWFEQNRTSAPWTHRQCYSRVYLQGSSLTRHYTRLTILFRRKPDSHQTKYLTDLMHHDVSIFAWLARSLSQGTQLVIVGWFEQSVRPYRHRPLQEDSVKTLSEETVGCLTPKLVAGVSPW